MAPAICRELSRGGGLLLTISTIAVVGLLAWGGLEVPTLELFLGLAVAIVLAVSAVTLSQLRKRLRVARASEAEARAAARSEERRSLDERKRAEAALKNRVRQQAAVAEIGLRSIGATRTGSLMDEIVRVVAETLDVEYAKVLALSPGGDDLHVTAGVGFDPEKMRSARICVGERSQAGYTLFLGAPVVATDLREEARFRADTILLEHEVLSGITVVIGSRRHPYGVLGAHSRAPRVFTHDDVHFLQAAANVLAAAIERERADGARRESELRFRQLAENLQEVLFLRDAAFTKMYYINPAFERVWGQSREALYEDPRAWMEAIHPEDAARITRVIGEDAQELEFRIIRPDGQLRWIHSRSFPVQTHGKPARLVGIVEDITERKEAEGNQRRLRRAELQDSGRGIPAEALPHIFDRFWREGDDGGHGASLGLGLAIVKGIVEAHDGRLRVDSEPGEGTTFTLVIPAPETPEQGRPADRSAA